MTNIWWATVSMWKAGRKWRAIADYPLLFWRHKIYIPIIGFYYERF